jgi:hypothetical protein
MRITSNQQTTNRNPLATSRERDLLPEDQFLACIRKERHRSDRSRAVLSLISARLPKRGGSYDPGLEYALEGILHRIRSLDEVGWLEPGVVGVLLPETSKEGAWHLVKELQRNDLTGYLRNAEISVYSYPDSLDGGPGDGGNGRREPAERNGHERRTPRVEREPAPCASPPGSRSRRSRWSGCCSTRSPGGSARWTSPAPRWRSCCSRR